jgi:hypothetical protein
MGDIEGNLNRLFQMIIDKNASLTDGVKTESNITEFEKLLRDTLILLNDNCNKYITYLFDNNKSNITFLTKTTCKNNSNVLNSFLNFYNEVSKDNSNESIKEALILLLYANTTFYRYIIKVNAIRTGLFTKEEFEELMKGLSQLKQSGGGNAKITKKSKKSILGKERCIYKKAGDRKEYLRYKGDLITVKDYTKLMKSKAAKAAKA